MRHPRSRTRCRAAGWLLALVLVPVLLATLTVPVQAQTGVAWSVGGSPEQNPCIELRRELFPPGQRQLVRVSYDGVAKLRELPSPLFAWPETLRGWGPACLAFRVTVGAGAAGPEVQQAQLLRIRIVQQRDKDREPHFGPYVPAARAMLPRLLSGSLLPQPPRPGEQQIVVVPLWPPHPLFSGDATQVWTPELAHLGFADARRIAHTPEVSLYVLGHGRGPEWLDLVVQRAFTPDEPIVDDTGGGNAVYGPATMRWVERDVLPALEPLIARGAAVQIRLYDRHILFPPVNPDYPPALQDFAPSFPPPSRDPLTQAPTSRSLGTLSFQAQRPSPQAPLQWRGGHTGERHQHNTLAEIQRAHAQSEERRAALLARRDQAIAAAPARRTAARQAFDDRVTRESAAAAERGLVYRSPVYWAHYHNDVYLAGILDGSFNRNLGLMLAELFVRYQAWFAGACAEQVPADAPGIQYVTVVRSGFNDPGMRIPGETIRVRPSRWPQFSAFLDMRARSAGVRLNPGIGLRSHGARELTQELALMGTMAQQITSDLQRLFGENGCDSGLARQFDENLHRLSQGLPTLQQEPGRQAYASQDSTRDAVRPSLLSACVEHSMVTMADRHEGELADRRRFCRCIAERFQGVLTPGERDAALADYDDFARKIYEVPQGGSNDPGWRYYRTANACRR